MVVHAKDELVLQPIQLLVAALDALLDGLKDKVDVSRIAGISGSSHVRGSTSQSGALNIPR